MSAEQAKASKAKRTDVIAALEAWDHFRAGSPDEACNRIHARAQSMSQRARDWYWSSIRSKRRASMAIRVASFGLLLAGATLPVLAAVRGEPADRLLMTQYGIIALALAGLLQAGDKVFGWSSGWLRYMTTVTAMEAATRSFELGWAAHLLTKSGDCNEADTHHLFSLAKQLESDLLRMQQEETDKWVGEFNSSMGLLNDLIKTQRDSAERTAEAARAALQARDTAEEERGSGSMPGAIEVTITREVSAAPLTIRLDDTPGEEFQGSVWSRVGVAAGLHKVEIADKQRTVVVQRVAKVPSGGIAAVEVAL